MTTATLTADAFFPAFQSTAKPTALQSLMRMWEEETAVEEEDSESELMVMLSGMVGPHATAIDE
jgi:hypothetical protein